MCIYSIASEVCFKHIRIISSKSLWIYILDITEILRNAFLKSRFRLTISGPNWVDDNLAWAWMQAISLTALQSVLAENWLPDRRLKYRPESGTPHPENLITCGEWKQKNWEKKSFSTAVFNNNGSKQYVSRLIYDSENRP